MSSSELCHLFLQGLFLYLFIIPGSFRSSDNSHLRRSSSSSSPSPNTSFSSLSSSVCNPQPHTLRTPLRSLHLPISPTTPTSRPSPLFRLLHPPSSPLPSPTMTVHHPTPLYSQPPSPTSSARPSALNSANRPSSRSERLLRDTLRRDEVERISAYDPPPPSATTSTYPASSPSNAHKRRHSHVPTSSMGTAAHEQHMREREEYTRGSFLFRTAMTNARPPSPSFSLVVNHQRHDSIAFGGDAECSVPSTPLKNEHRHRNAVTPDLQGMSSGRGTSPVSNARSQSNYSPVRNASPSPSPMRRSHGSQHRPFPLLLEKDADSYRYRRRSSKGINENTSVHYRMQQRGRESPSNHPRSRHDPSFSPSHGEPLLMTPHEQVLRARLEKVLKSGKVLEKKEHGRRDRSGSGSASNEVRDEEGGRPWRRTGQSTALPSDSVCSHFLRKIWSNSFYRLCRSIPARCNLLIVTVALNPF